MHPESLKQGPSVNEAFQEFLWGLEPPGLGDETRPGCESYTDLTPSCLASGPGPSAWIPDLGSFQVTPHVLCPHLQLWFLPCPRDVPSRAKDVFPTNFQRFGDCL